MSATRPRKILYVQFTNPAGYPPLEHSSHILAEEGWRVLFVGTEADSVSFPFHPHDNIQVRLQRFVPPGVFQKISYLWFLIRCLFWRFVFHPTVVYCSDPLSAPAGLLLGVFGSPVLYHEHDVPPVKVMNGLRRRLAKRALACILPQKERLRDFHEAMQPEQTFLVWNCPRRSDVVEKKRSRADDKLHLFYVGSLGPSLLPMVCVEALSRCGSNVFLHVVGYETAGTRGYASQIREKAQALGVSDQVELHGFRTRREFYRMATAWDVGLSFITPEVSNKNLQHLVGASNKFFDYLACGLLVVVPDSTEWKSLITPGYGISCPATPDDLAVVYKKLALDPSLCLSMGENGRQRVLKDWNYETQFSPVKEMLEMKYPRN